MASLKKTPQEEASAAALKAQREKDAAQAMREYRAQEVALLANTARLRALRLAQETEAAKPAKRRGASTATTRSAQRRTPKK